jgi:N utilization substance protein B
MLYQMDVGKIDLPNAIKSIQDEDGITEDPDYAAQIAEGVTNRLADIDSTITRYAVGWNLGRMAAIDRNILRIAVYEMAFLEERVPVRVALNEAVELAKLYGDADSGKFVNGVLANVVKGLNLSDTVTQQ